MDLTAIEATSIAVRAGQVAAAELMGLLTTDVPGPVHDWFAPQLVASLHEDDIVALVATIDRLGGYVCHSPDPVSGERLYRWAMLQHLAPRAEWVDLPFGQRQAYELFATTVRAVYLPLRVEQERLDARPPPHQQSLALEDSIFEPEEPLGALRKESVAAAPMIAAYDAAQAAAPPAPTSQSIGEAPPRHHGNQGGRGRRKN